MLTYTYRLSICYNTSGDNMKTEIHSYESFGTVDGPGIRFIVFFQGCLMRCAYCHNPDTWIEHQGRLVETEDIVQEILKYKTYFKNGGGVTLSGGEPLLQMEAVIALLKRLKEEGLHTCVDTCGITFDSKDEHVIQNFDALLEVTDLFLLDIKHIDDIKHQELTGQSNVHTLAFAKYLNEHHKPVWIRYVLVPNISDQESDIIKLKQFLNTLDNIEKIEVLPYHTMGLPKYEKLGIDYRLKGVHPPSKALIERANEILQKGLK